MRVEIIEGFEVDTASGPVRYERGQVVGNGQKNWVDKGLAVEAADEAPKTKPEPESAEKPKG
ncbi:hypothetical protein [Aureimonas sp. ME7]|uniref:hypothetical protein n=1 Tax=Aureimonas sp. ME7 TaxID=2744252 RepID=UPI0015F65C41|nr:hypothetical protein [Aureimonas sp. ME7]